MAEPRPLDKTSFYGRMGYGWAPEGDYNAAVVRVPRRMVKIGDLTQGASQMQDHTDFCELYDIRSSSSRTSDDRSSNHLYSSSTVSHSHVRLAIPVGDYATSIEQNMNDGNVIDDIQVDYIVTIMSTTVAVQTILYSICQIQFIEQTTDSDGRDVLLVDFRFIHKKNTINKYTQDGQNQGQKVTEIDYSTSVTS